jgi:hypothetical protein
MKVITFTTPLFEANCVVVVQCPFSKFLAFLKKRHGGKVPQMYSWSKEFEFKEDADTTDAYQFHVCSERGSRDSHGQEEVFYSWILDPTSSALLYHEVQHLTGDILYTRGVEYEDGGEETYSYLGGWIFEKVFTALGGRIPKKTKK